MITWITGAWGWLKANPVVARILTWFAIGLALFVGAKTYKAKVEAATRKKVEAEFEKKASRTEAAVAERRIDINKTETRSANEALEARDTERPVPPTADGVRREAADILFRTESD